MRPVVPQWWMEHSKCRAKNPDDQSGVNAEGGYYVEVQNGEESIIIVRLAESQIVTLRDTLNAILPA